VESEDAQMPSTHSALHYHTVFRTKNREPWFPPSVREPVHACLGGIIKNRDGDNQKQGRRPRLCRRDRRPHPSSCQLEANAPAFRFDEGTESRISGNAGTRDDRIWETISLVIGLLAPLSGCRLWAKIRCPLTLHAPA